MKKVLFKWTKSIAACVLFSSTAFSQEEHQLITTPQLKISYVGGLCDVEPGKQAYQFAFLKIENLTNTTLHVGFNIVTQFAEGCSGCNANDESLYYLSLIPNQVYTTSRKSIFVIPILREHGTSRNYESKIWWLNKR